MANNNYRVHVEAYPRRRRRHRDRPRYDVPSDSSDDYEEDPYHHRQRNANWLGQLPLQFGTAGYGPELPRLFNDGRMPPFPAFPHGLPPLNFTNDVPFRLPTADETPDRYYVPNDPWARPDHGTGAGTDTDGLSDTVRGLIQQHHEFARRVHEVALQGGLLNTGPRPQPTRDPAPRNRRTPAAPQEPPNAPRAQTRPRTEVPANTNTRGDPPAPSETTEPSECPICQDRTVDCKIVHCGHKFCGRCIDHYRRYQGDHPEHRNDYHLPVCPICRGPLGWHGGVVSLTGGGQDPDYDQRRRDPFAGMPPFRRDPFTGMPLFMI